MTITIEAINNSDDEMWKINKRFIFDAHQNRNTFYFSHNPTDPNVVKGFFKKEIEYLKELGYTINPNLIGEDLWIAII